MCSPAAIVVNDFLWRYVQSVCIILIIDLVNAEKEIVHEECLKKEKEEHLEENAIQVKEDSS